MAQWVKNPTAVAQVAAGAQDPSLAQCSGLKNPALPQLWYRLQLLLRFSPINPVLSFVTLFPASLTHVQVLKDA